MRSRIDSIARFLTADARRLGTSDLAACRRVLTRATDHVAGLAAPPEQHVALLRKGVAKAELTAKQRHALMTVLLGAVAGYERNVTSARQHERHERNAAQCEERGVHYTSRQVHPTGKLNDKIAEGLALRGRQLPSDDGAAGNGVLERTSHREMLAAYRQAMERGLIADVDIRHVSDAVGSGVFARTAIPANAFVGEYTGAVIYPPMTELAAFAHENAYLFDYAPYYLGTEGSAQVDARDSSNFTRFVNHSSKPNCAVGYMRLDDGWHVYYVANRDIAPGEQLTIDYGPNYWGGRDKPLELT